jgi:YHS domain-containing protein
MKNFTSCATLALLCLSAFGADPVDPVSKDSAGLALKGYDTVAYFTSGKPEKGTQAFTHLWNGAEWRFRSQENRELFKANPEKYAPRFGGYCAWAVSNNYTAPSDPTAWRIVDGKLYLNYNASVQKKWAAELEARIASAEKNWGGLHK